MTEVLRHWTMIDSKLVCQSHKQLNQSWNYLCVKSTSVPLNQINHLESFRRKICEINQVFINKSKHTDCWKWSSKIKRQLPALHAIGPGC